MTTLNADASRRGARGGRVGGDRRDRASGCSATCTSCAQASGVAAEVDAAAVPAIDGVLDLLPGDEPPIAGGTRRNREWVEEWVDWDDAVPEHLRWLLCDAMTSGGLLVAAPRGRAAGGRADRPRWSTATPGASPSR